MRGVAALDGTRVAQALHFAVRFAKPACELVGGVAVEDVGDDRELQLALGAPHAVVYQLGLDVVDEALGEGVDAAIVKESLAWRVGRL